MVLRQKGATRCNLHRMSFLSLVHTVAAGGAEGRSAPHYWHADGTFYVRPGLGDGVTADVCAAVRRSTWIASTALRTPVSSKSVQMARIHEPRSGHTSKIQNHDVAPNKLANSEAPSKRATGKATSQVSRRPRRMNWGRRCWRCSNFLDQRRKRRSGQSAKAESTTRTPSMM